MRKLGAFLLLTWSWSLVADGQDVTWVASQVLVPSDPRDADNFGGRIAIAGDVAVIGSRSGVYVFARRDGTWVEEDKLSLADPGRGPVRQAPALAISGDTIVAASVADDDSESSHVHAFVRRNGGWESLGSVFSTSWWTVIENSIALDANIAVAGGPAPNEPPGAAYVLERAAGGWEHTRTITPATWTRRDWFGESVAISGQTIFVGVTQDLALPSQVKVYSKVGADWLERQTLMPAGPDEYWFGRTLAVAGDLAVFGSWRDPSGSVVHIFERAGELWSETDIVVRALSTESLAASENWIAAASDEGLQLLARTSSGWSALEPIPLPNDHINYFGSSVAMNGDAVLVGARIESIGDVVEGGAVYAYVPRFTAGSSCAQAAECASEHCVAGVCCDRACGACGSCASGVCTAHASGSAGDPSCAPFVCNGTDATCPDACTGDSDCLPDHYCEASQCHARRADGSACARSSECASANCVDDRCLGTRPDGEECAQDADCGSATCRDGRCCNETCAGACEACDVPGSEGTCSAVEGAPRGDRPQCSSDGSICGGRCDGVERANCSYPSSAESCGSSCEDGLLTRSSCDGQGSCSEGAKLACPNNLTCAAQDRCHERCESDDDCVSPYACLEDGTCGPGAVCSDEQTSQKADGRIERCSPYLCGTDGACKAECTSKADCVSPYVCDSAGRCVTYGARKDSGGCAAIAGKRERDGASAGLLALAAWLWWQRRRRA